MNVHSDNVLKPMISQLSSLNWPSHQARDEPSSRDHQPPVDEQSTDCVEQLSFISKLGAVADRSATSQARATWLPVQISSQRDIPFLSKILQVSGRNQGSPPPTSSKDNTFAPRRTISKRRR
mmetsp:Transcript_80347/g.215391  ORF Transcript_80347/g.215391 Transcript_80347/m.215391 type:complete len:122 (-) Transcript_80347:561-926(-)